MQQRERQAIARMKGLPIDSVPLEPVDQPDILDRPRPKKRISLAADFTRSDEDVNTKAVSLAQLLAERAKHFRPAVEMENFEADTNDD